MIEGSTALNLDDAYLELWQILLEKRCRVVEAVPPYALAAAQGAWWALATRNGQTDSFLFTPSEAGTRVVSEAYWSPLLVAGLMTAHIACYFLLVFATPSLSVHGMDSLLRSTYGLTLLGLVALAGILIVFHTYGYAARILTARQILTTLNLSCTPILAERTQHHLGNLRETAR